YAIHVQLPSWLFFKAWDYQVLKSAAGWQTNLQVWNIRPSSSLVFLYARMATLGANLNVLKTLLAMGVDVCALDRRGKSAVHTVGYFFLRKAMRDYNVTID
ncbi:hypothetical protein BN1723_015712, partial [Verticillium longisporum]